MEKAKEITTNWSKGQSSFKEGDPVYMAGLEESPKLETLSEKLKDYMNKYCS